VVCSFADANRPEEIFGVDIHIRTIPVVPGARLPTSTWSWDRKEGDDPIIAMTGCGNRGREVFLASRSVDGLQTAAETSYKTLQKLQIVSAHPTSKHHALD
jgi:hypothetical protein